MYNIKVLGYDHRYIFTDILLKITEAVLLYKAYLIQGVICRGENGYSNLDRQDG